ncbi:MAG: DUF1211 domain-containing protein, partial [Acidobacteria bacterium]|nr:DUF1211 domain-containing protein [Acidobacteriota bacterium]
WNNHHHLLHTVRKVTGGILWANLHLLFWLSLFPFVSGWMGENHLAKMPTALYGLVLLMAALAYFLLQSRIIASQGEGSLLAKALGNDLKGKISPLFYIVGIGASFYAPWIAASFYILTALIWLIPDRRIERTLRETGG